MKQEGGNLLLARGSLFQPAATVSNPGSPCLPQDSGMLILEPTF